MSRPATNQKTGGELPLSLPAPKRPQLVPPSPKAPRKSGWGWLWALAGVLVGAGVYTWQSIAPVKTPAPGAVATVPWTSVQPRPFVQSLRLAGVVSAKDSAAIRAPRLRVRSQLTLTELAEAGTFVKAGDVVARFESRELQDRVDDMRSNHAQAQARLERDRAQILIEREAMRQDRDRVKAEFDKAQFDLRKAEVLSQIEAELLRNTAAQAEAEWRQLEGEIALQEKVFERRLRVEQINVAEARLRHERFERDLNLMTLRAPVGGLVVLEPMYKGGGQFQQATAGDQIYPGTTFLRVVDLSGLRISASINQVDANAVRVGQPATIRFDAYPDLAVEGRVSNVGAIAGDGGGFGSRGGGSLYVKSVPVEIAFEPSDPRIIPDLSAAVDVQLAKRDDSLIAPLAAVEEREGEMFVHVRAGSAWSPRRVELGERNEVEAVILAGIEPGEEIALRKPERP